MFVSSSTYQFSEVSINIKQWYPNLQWYRNQNIVVSSTMFWFCCQFIVLWLFWAFANITLVKGEPAVQIYYFESNINL